MDGDSMPGETSNNASAMALGTLIGTVNGLVKSIDEQNKMYLRNVDEQNKKGEEGRKEFLKSFGILTDSIATQTKILQDHIADDNLLKATVALHETWKKEQAQPVLDDYTAKKNRIAGAWWMGGLVGGSIVGLITLIVWAINTFGIHHV